MAAIRREKRHRPALIAAIARHRHGFGASGSASARGDASSRRERENVRACRRRLEMFCLAGLLPERGEPVGVVSVKRMLRLARVICLLLPPLLSSLRAKRSEGGAARILALYVSSFKQAGCAFLRWRACGVVSHALFALHGIG